MRQAVRSVGIFGLILGLVVFGMGGTLPHAHNADSVHQDCLLCRAPVAGVEPTVVTTLLHLPAPSAAAVVSSVERLFVQAVPRPSHERAPPVSSSIA